MPGPKTVAIIRRERDWMHGKPTKLSTPARWRVWSTSNYAFHDDMHESIALVNTFEEAIAKADYMRMVSADPADVAAWALAHAENPEHVRDTIDRLEAA